jgi:hypothetical protein
MLIFSQFYLPGKFIGGLQDNSRVWFKDVGSLLKMPCKERKTEIGVRARRMGGHRQGDARAGQGSPTGSLSHCIGEKVPHAWQPIEDCRWF